MPTACMLALLLGTVCAVLCVVGCIGTARGGGGVTTHLSVCLSVTLTTDRRVRPPPHLLLLPGNIDTGAARADHTPLC